MEQILDSPLMTVLAIITVATILALIRTLKRDRCLMHFDDYHISLAKEDGTVTWGRVDVTPSGLEVHYPDPRRSAKGFWKQSLLHFKEHYESMTGLYRCTAGLSEEQRNNRAAYLRKTSDPGFFRRLYRNLRNWMGMIRDAVVQSVSLAVGAARSRGRPTANVLAQDEEQVAELSKEIVGHAGNAYDPLLERHLFTRVIVDVTRDGTTREYCGYLADYTDQFLEIIDAGITPEIDDIEPRRLQPGDETVDGVEIRVDGDRLIIDNTTGTKLLLKELEDRETSLRIGAIIPDGFVAEFRIGRNISSETLNVVVGTADRIDMIVPRSHAIVRHGVSGLEKDKLGTPPT